MIADRFKTNANEVNAKEIYIASSNVYQSLTRSRHAGGNVKVNLFELRCSRDLCGSL